jgi:hypothetical protein
MVTWRWLTSTVGDGPGGDGAEVGGPQALGVTPAEDVGRQVDEAVLEAGGAGERERLGPR